MSAERLFNKKYLGYCVVIMLVVAAAIIYNVKKKTFLKKGLPELVEDKSKRLYKISYDAITVDELNGNVFIRNLVVEGDTLRQQQLIDAKDTSAQKTLFQIRIPEAQLTGFKTSKALLSKKIICDKIIINNPSTVIYIYPLQRKQDIKKHSQEFYKQLLGKFELVQTNEVEIINANVLALDFKTKERKFEALNTSINLNDVRIDSIANEDTTRSFFCKDLAVRTKKLETGNKGKTTDIYDASYTTTNNLLEISRIEHADKVTGALRTTLGDLTISNLHVKGPMEEVLVSANNITIGKALFETKKQQNKGQNENKQASKILPPWLKRVHVNSFKAPDISFKQVADQKDKDLEIKHTSVTISTIHVDSTSNLDNEINKLFGEVRVNNPRIVLTSTNQDYQFAFSKLEFNSKERTIKFNDFSVTPLLSEEAFAKKAKVMKDRYDIKLNDILCSDVNFNKLIKGEINIGRIATSNGYFKVSLDARYPPAGKSKLGKYPNQMLFSVKSPVNIGALALRNAFIEYKEKSPLTDSSGSVSFKNTDLVVTNVTNRPKGKNDISEWNFKSSLLGAVTVRSKMKFYLNEQEKGKFDISGSMDAVDATIFNVAARPISLMNIDHGRASYARFDFKGDNYGIKGQFSLKYDDFKISLLKKKENDKIRKKNLKTFIANLVVKSSNKNKHGDQQLDVYFKRDTTKSFFHTLWHAMFKGIRDILLIVI